VIATAFGLASSATPEVERGVAGSSGFGTALPRFVTDW